jgi:hypothetical protein
LFAPSAFAQEATTTANDDKANEAAEIQNGDIIVHGTIIRGQVDAPQPPIMTLDEEDIASYGASSIEELIAALAPETGSGRGRGDGRPVILINGRRISNFREFRNIPPEAIRRMQILPEEVALRFGYAANQRVINFILKDKFNSRTLSGEYDTPTRGGFADSEIEGTMLNISGNNRLNLNAQVKDTSLLTESERDVIQQPGTTPTLATDPNPAEFRSLVPDSRALTLTGSWSTGIGKNGASLSLNGQIARSDSRSLSGLDSVTIGNVLRTFDDPLARTTRTVTAQGGAALNTNVGKWQLSATVDASQGKTETRIDQRRLSADLIAAAIAGVHPSPGGIDVARSRNSSLDSLLTLSGTPFRMPAGEVSVTFKTGFDYTGIRSTDTRTAGAGTIALDRGDLSAGVNIGLPITSRRDNVLAGIGDLSFNLSAGLNRLSDFGTLKDWSAGLTWSPIEKLGLQVSYLVNEEAPSLAELGNPTVQNFNVPVFDFTRGETVLVTTTTGGNPDLVAEKQRDWKFAANYQLPFLKNSNLIVEYFRNRSTDVTAAFPVLTPDIEAAFSGRVRRCRVTDTGCTVGQLLAIDRRAVTFDETTGSRLRYGFNISGTIGKPQPGAQRGQGFGGPGGPGGGPPGGGGGFRGGSGGGGGFRGGGGPMGAMGGGGNGQGRWNLSIFHTIRFSENVLIAPGGPSLDLLDGDALTGGGVARNALEMEGGTFYKGFGLRFNGTWTAPTELRSTTGGSDLRFGSLLDIDLRAFVNFDQQKSIVSAVPFLKGARLSLKVENVFDSRQKVTDNTGEVPISYQADFLDPRGRVLGIDFRKMF